MILENFYKEVLQKLGVLAAEESPSASDRLAAQNKYEQVHAEFSRREIVPWFDDDEVPDWIADGFAAIVADRLTSKFSVSDNDLIKIKTEAREGLTTLVADGQRRSPPASKPQYY